MTIEVHSSIEKSVTVIGGGLGGISAAIALAQSGYKVALYEKNQHIGGKLNRLEVEGYGFDLGPSILTMPFIFERLFLVGNKKMEDYVKFEKLDLQWRSFFTDGTTIDLYEQLSDMDQHNPSLSKKDMEEYEAFLEYSKSLYEITQEGYFDKGLDTTFDIIKYHGPISAFKGFDLLSTMSSAIEKRISNPHLRDMLKYYIKYVGSSAEDAPAILNMLAYMQHDLGLWYVPGGMHKLGEALQKLALEEGVAIYNGQEVVRLEKDTHKNITAAVLANGEIVESDYYVSNMEVIPTYRYLLDEDKKGMKKLEEKFEPAASGMVLHLGVDKLYPQLAHHNFFFSNDSKKNYESVFHRHELPEDPTIYLVNVNKTDSGQAPEGHENIKILPHIPYVQDEPFTDQQYADLRERVLIKLENMGLTDLREHIVFEDMWLPEDIQQTYYSNRGAIYGVLADKKANNGFKHPKHSDRYDNLYFVGGSVNPGGGMPMVTLSGQQVRDMIVRRDAKS
ncbi:NAD(P)/FAD-dependent oxidoreductase [Marinilactibacillus sp. Marseille-P9653]|uniref:phytoene desaturase family protein n=1 Tax=Marinilactibacillus sp. Marseille-P9653 TaxID=2866583 RepID=UPI001CE4281F|nr:phytoene desaturase family protein [Marinilactibacillus sp. Marseille-P9653]